MRYRPYPEYRDSGVEWLGSVPRGWDVKRFRYSCRIQEGQVDPEDERFSERVLIAPNHIESGTGKILLREASSEQGAISGKYRVDPGDLIYSKIRPALRKACISEGHWLCSADMYPIRVTGSRLKLRFLLYSVLSDPFSRLMIDESMRVAMPKVNRETLADTPLLLPPAADQAAIVTLLDSETARIDALVAKKERLIELLNEKRAALITRGVTKGLDPNVPMKDSGVEWLGEIPAYWKVKPLKSLAAVQTGITLGKQYEGQKLETRPYLRVANVQDGHLDLEHIAQIQVPWAELPNYELRSGDVLMTEGGDFDKLGRGYVWEGQISGCLHQNHVFAVRPQRGRLEPHFLSAILSSGYGRAYFTATSKQSTNLASTNSTKLREFPLPLPDLPEQQRIATFLGKEGAKLSQVVLRTETSVALLREYRAVLVSAAVTGKIDVRGGTRGEQSVGRSS